MAAIGKKNPTAKTEISVKKGFCGSAPVWYFLGKRGCAYDI